MNKRFQHLYSTTVWTLAALLTIAMAAAPSLLAQRKKQSGPRAIAVVSWNGDSPKPVPHASVLTPIAVLVEGRYYDANLYETQPEPLAVDSGVVYDVLKSNEPIGTFTVGGAREKDDVWYGTGLFEPKGAITVQMNKSTAQTTRAGDTAAASKSGSEDDRPKLRRGTPPPPAPKEQTDAVLTNIDRDPERPTLRRHSASESKPQQSVSAPAPQFTLPETHMLPAVSDAGGPEPHSFAPHYKSGELTQIREDMEKLVRSELAKLKKPQAAAPAKSPRTSRARSSAPAAAAPEVELSNPSFGVFDVNANNAPIVVYAASAMIDGVKKYVTVAAWEEIDQSLRRIFTQVTDDTHLDVYPRLQIVDAVDASGNGRGELLFRAFGDQGNRFVLYHPGPDSLTLLFDSAKGESSR
ncbi:MAG: hypothetical protein JOZ10_06550 [Acidobacteria bacterium]|nr:hypothetical protein [Acidobacteriota bacterium]